MASKCILGETPAGSHIERRDWHAILQKIRQASRALVHVLLKHCCQKKTDGRSKMRSMKSSQYFGWWNHHKDGGGGSCYPWKVSVKQKNWIFWYKTIGSSWSPLLMGRSSNKSMSRSNPTKKLTTIEAKDLDQLLWLNKAISMFADMCCKILVLTTIDKKVVLANRR